MRLVSANLEYKTAWSEEMLPRAAALLAATGADVIAVQECPGPEALEKLAGALGYEHRIAPSPTGIHTGILWAPHVREVSGGDKYAERIGAGTWHGFTSSTLVSEGWPSPVTVISAHLVPHEVDGAVAEARFLQTRVRREGWPGILVGDLNHGALEGPEPPWDEVPEHNRASRTILDQDDPERIRLDRRVGLALTRGGLVDVAARVADRDGNAGALAHTGVHGKIRVDQCWVTGALAPAIADYERLDHQGVTDHHPVQIDLDLEDLPPIGQVEFH